MPLIYRAVTVALAATGCLALLAGGEINPVYSLAAIGIVPGGYRVIRGRPPAPRWFLTASSLFALIVFFADALLNRDVFLAVAHLTIVIQVLKSFDLREPWDHLQVYFVSLLQLVIVTEMTNSVIFAVIFVVFMIVLVAAMVLSHFLKEGALGRVALARPVAVLVALTVACTAVLFLVMPRTPYRFVGKGHLRAIKTVGFSERVDFGSFGAVKLDPTVVMRILLEGPRTQGLYWRGVALDYFDGETWGHSERSRRAIFKTDDLFSIGPFDPGTGTVQRIYREAIDSDVIFGLPAVKAVKSGAFRMVVDGEQALYLPGRGTQKISYTVYTVRDEGMPGRPEQRYLQMPPLSARLAELSSRIVAGAAAMGEKAARIEDYLRRNYTYSLAVRRPPAGVNAIEDFLFTTKKGYCEHYATSMALLLRAQGIPSRIVTGFYGGEQNDYGDYIIIRRSDAHAWVEALIGGIWKRYDPTPPVRQARPSAVALVMDSITMVWSRYVVGFSFEDQKAIARTIAVPFSLPSLQGVRSVRLNPHFFILPALVLTGLALARLARRLLLTRKSRSTPAFLRVRRLLRRRGFDIGEDATAGALRRLTRGTAFSGAVEEFTRLYEMNRFGRKDLSRSQWLRYAALLKAIARTSGRGHGRPRP